MIYSWVKCSGCILYFSSKEKAAKPFFLPCEQAGSPQHPHFLSSFTLPAFTAIKEPLHISCALLLRIRESLNFQVLKLSSAKLNMERHHIIQQVTTLSTFTFWFWFDFLFFHFQKNKTFGKTTPTLLFKCKLIGRTPFNALQLFMSLSAGNKCSTSFGLPGCLSSENLKVVGQGLINQFQPSSQWDR